MIRKKSEYTLEHRSIGGGVGELAVRNKFTPAEVYEKCRICAEITLEPGQSIGMHKHEVEAEIFYMLAGELISIGEDGGEEPFCQGDMMITGGGDSHSLRNDSGAAATILAIVIR